MPAYSPYQIRYEDALQRLGEAYRIYKNLTKGYDGDKRRQRFDKFAIVTNGLMAMVRAQKPKVEEGDRIPIMRVGSLEELAQKTKIDVKRLRSFVQGVSAKTGIRYILSRKT